jgi:hypothetical protein
MNNASQMLEVLVSTQAKSLENLMDTTSKLRNSLGQPNALETSATVMKEWYQRQESITKEMAGAVKDFVIPEQPANFIQEWLKAQEGFGQQWFGTMKDTVQNLSAEKVLDLYKGGADKIFEVWKKSFDQFAGMFTTSFGLKSYDPATQAQEMHHNFVESARGYIKMLDDQIEKVKGSMS